MMADGLEQTQSGQASIFLSWTKKKISMELSVSGKQRAYSIGD